MSRRLFGQALRFLPGAAYPAASSLLLSAVLARTIEPAQLGRFAAAQAIVALVSAAGIQWIAQPINFFAAARTESADVFRSALSLAVRSIGVVAILGATIAFWNSRFESDVSTRIIETVAVGLAAASTAGSIALLAFWQALIRALDYSKLQFTFNLARFTGAVLCGWLFNGASGALIGGALAGALILLGELRRMLELYPKPVDRRVRRVWIGRLWLYGAPFIPWSLFSTVASVSDRLVIGNLLSQEILAIYAVQYTLATGAAYLASTPLLLFVHPETMRLWAAGDKDQARRELRRSILYLCAVGLATVVGAVLWGARLTSFVFGPAYVAESGVLPWLCAGTMLWQICLFAQKPLEASGESSRLAVLMFVAAATNVALTLLLVLAIGIRGAAIAPCETYAVYLTLLQVADGRGAKGAAVLAVACAVLIVLLPQDVMPSYLFEYRIRLAGVLVIIASALVARGASRTFSTRSTS